jgi:hypothetical protein
MSKKSMDDLFTGSEAGICIDHADLPGLISHSY